MSKGTIFWLVVLALVITLGLSIAFRTERLDTGEGEGSRIFRNPAYAYSFEYPENIVVMQYAPEHVSIGRPTDEGFQTFINVEAALSRADEESANFDDFLFDRAKALCAADSPRETMDCDRVEKRTSFVSSRGAAGTELTMRLVRRNLASGTTTESAFGPVYAFDLSSVTSSRDAALLVYVPLSSYGIPYPPVSAEGIARSVSLGR